MSGLTSVDGIISGLKTTDIIDAMMAVQRRRVTLMEVTKQRAANELTVYQSMTAKLLSVQSDAEALARASTFDARTATSSDTTILTASAGTQSPVGIYQLTVSSVARSHQVASQGFADTDTDTVGTGTLELTVNGNTTMVTVDTSNNTLEGLKDAINLAGTDVKATIVNDGGSTHPHRLLLTSSNTGVENAITITSGLTGGTTPNFTSNSITSPVADDANFYSGTASAAGAYTGTSGKTYLVQIVDGGALDAATYEVSEDGGVSWGSETTLSGTINAYDDAHGSNLGAQMSFTEGTFAAGDQFTMRAFVPTVQQAADATIEFGSGDGKIEITSASNRVTTAIPGVTISLVSADPTKAVTLEIAPDKEGVKNRITSLVANFNGAVDYITARSGYDSTTKTAGLLLGNTTMIRLQGALRATALASVTGTATYDSLLALGVSINDSGSLTIDQAALQAALDGSPDDVATIFKTTGASTNSKISLVSSSSSSKETTIGYDVDITQAATRGKLTGTSIADPAVTPLVIDSTNNQLIVDINGTTSGILELTQKTYASGAELAQEIQSKISQDDYLDGKTVSVRFVDQGATGYFEITSGLYGATSSVSIGEPANNAATVLGLTGGTASAGTDVAGTIGGEAATGSGQFLTGNSSNANTANLKLRVTLSAAELVDGAEGTLTLTKGVGAKVTDLLKNVTDGVDGLLAAKQKTAQTQIDDATERIAEMEKTFETRRQRLVDKFTAMEKTLAVMQQQSSYLGLQLNALTNQNNSTQ